MLEELGPPPSGKPLKLARWWNDLMAQVGWLYAQGKIPVLLADKLRAIASSSSRTLPADIIQAAQQRLRRDEEDMKDPFGHDNVVSTADYEANVTGRAPPVRGQ